MNGAVVFIDPPILLNDCNYRLLELCHLQRMSASSEVKRYRATHGTEFPEKINILQRQRRRGQHFRGEREVRYLSSEAEPPKIRPIAALRSVVSAAAPFAHSKGCSRRILTSDREKDVIIYP